MSINHVMVYSFARVAGAKHSSMGGLNSRHLFSHSSGGWESESTVLAGLGSSEASLSGM